MNNEILSKVDEIIDILNNSDSYKKYLDIKSQMNENPKLMNLIREIKVLQKDVVHHLDKKKELEEKQKELEDYPLYREYCNVLDELNNSYNIIENSINKYFSDKIN